MKGVFKKKDIIEFGSRACIRITVVDPVFYDSFAVFGACIISGQIVHVSNPRIVPSKNNWANNVDTWVADLQKSPLRGVIDVLCIKHTHPSATWKIFMDPKEEAERISILTRQFEKSAQRRGVDLRVFPYGPNETLVENIQTYIEELK